MATRNRKRFVLITTDHNYRGVFAGLLAIDKAPATVTLEKARNVINWRNGKGVFGLASDGPDDRCKIGPQVDKVKLFNITSITDISKDAEKAWKSL